MPVRDVDRALRFYVDQVGFTLDVDYSPNDAFRVVQLTPRAPAAQVRRDHKKSVGEQRNQIMKHVACAREAVQQQLPRVGWPRFTIENLETVAASGRHHDLLCS